jgi:hypothetical protein
VAADDALLAGLFPVAVAFEVSDAGLLMPNCPDMNTCAALESWDLSCWPRVVVGASVALEPLGVIETVADSSPWHDAAPEKFIPRKRCDASSI